MAVVSLIILLNRGESYITAMIVNRFRKIGMECQFQKSPNFLKIILKNFSRIKSITSSFYTHKPSKGKCIIQQKWSKSCRVLICLYIPNQNKSINFLDIRRNFN